MNNFAYTRVGTTDEAIKILQADGRAVLVAGGSDLIPLMKDEIVNPTMLVEISTLGGGDRIEATDEGLSISATTTLSQIAASERVKREYAALAEACSLAASPQLRNMGTLGGNLLQQTRCWYYRGEHLCWLKGGETCYARNGENELHSIFLNAPSESRCVSAHPSDPAVALLALGAVVRGKSLAGEFERPVDELFALPTEERRNFVELPAGAVLTEILLPPAEDVRSVYLKAMPRAAWAFALAGVAIYLRCDGEQIIETRVALGGVAPIPFRATWVEAAMSGSTLSSLKANALADVLVEGATPLSQNGYKVPLLRGLFKEALAQAVA